MQELYYAIKEVGLADAAELVALATPEQVQGFVDLDVWERDHLDERRVDAWMDTLADAGYEKLGAIVEALDPEVIALWLQRQAVLRPDHRGAAARGGRRGTSTPRPIASTSSTSCVGGEEGKALERMLDWMYRDDLELGAPHHHERQVGARLATSRSTRYRWRTGRMADLGYVDFYEALSIYQWLDPASVKVDEHTLRRAAAGDADRAAGGAGRLARRGRLLRQARWHARRPTPKSSGCTARWCCSSTRRWRRTSWSPATSSAARSALGRAVAYVGLGLEYLSRGDADARRPGAARRSRSSASSASASR